MAEATAAPLPDRPAAPLPDRPAPPAVRAALVLVAALAGFSYAWSLGSDALEPYYAASVRSMATSWHDFVFAAFDPAGTVSIDKLPGALWVQALAVRAFGYHTWAVVLPQAVEGVLAVLFLYRAVRRLAGPLAGLASALVLAVSPSTVALDRGNISDSLMILLLVLAADAVSGAVVTGSPLRLVAAGVFVGLAFQAKMIEAWMVLPALALPYLVGAPGGTGRRLSRLAVAGAVAAAVSLSWLTAVDLVPAHERPYVDGSHDDSTYEQVFVYNGFGRFGDHTPLQLLAGQSLGLGTQLAGPAPSPARLLHGGLGRDGGWLLPAAAAAAVLVLAARRRRPRDDLLRCSALLWGTWLVTLVAVFSAITTINAYYTAALSPAVAALLGTAVAVGSDGARPGLARLAAPGALAAGSVGYALWLLSGPGGRVPPWLVPVAATAGAAALALSLAVAARRAQRLRGPVLAVGLVAALVVPAAASGELVAGHRGAFDTPFERPPAAAAVEKLFQTIPAQVGRAIPRLDHLRFGAPYLLAAETSALASVFIEDSGLEALPIGGFTGTNPSPTLGEIRSDVASGSFHLVLAASSRDPRLAWIAAHCANLGSAGANLRAYYCVRRDAG